MHLRHLIASSSAGTIRHRVHAASRHRRPGSIGRGGAVGHVGRVRGVSGRRSGASARSAARSAHHRRPPAAAGRGGLRAVSREPRSASRARARGARDRALYTHQAEAIDHALHGRNVVVDHADGVGQDALLQRAGSAEHPRRRVVERRCISFRRRRSHRISWPSCTRWPQLVGAEGGGEIGVFTYDGDTPQDARRAIRARAHVVLSNPDMMHSGDPAAPSAVGEALREPEVRRHRRAARLSRCVRQPSGEHHAAAGGESAGTTVRDPTFICSSATIANPRELAERLIGGPFELVDRSGAPRGEKFFLFVNPPVVNRELGIRRSYLAETRRVAIEFLKRGLQLIVFAQSRLSTEILTTYLKDAFQGATRRCRRHSRLSRRLSAAAAP